MMSYVLIAMEKARIERHRPKRPVSLKHVEELLNHMEQFPTFALASIRCKKGTQAHSKYMWNRIATVLNKLDEDVHKSPKAWARFWVDLRFKIRRKYLNYGRCVRARRPWHGGFAAYQKRVVDLLTDADGNLIDAVERPDRVNRLSVAEDHSDNGELSNVVIKVERDDHTYSDTEQAQEQKTEELIRETDHFKTDEASYNKTTEELNMDHKITDPTSYSKTTEELNREMVEFELRKGKELLEIEKKHREEKHVLDIAILELRKQLLVKELKDT